MPRSVVSSRRMRVSLFLPHLPQLITPASLKRNASYPHPALPEFQNFLGHFRDWFSFTSHRSTCYVLLSLRFPTLKSPFNAVCSRFQSCCGPALGFLLNFLPPVQSVPCAHSWLPFEFIHSLFFFHRCCYTTHTHTGVLVCVYVCVCVISIL